MKRFFCALLALMIVFSVVPAASAAESEQAVVYFADGSYIVSEVVSVNGRASGSVSGSKPYTYYSADGRSLWKATLSGTFRYTGSSAVCTSASISTTVYDSSWRTISKSSEKEGSAAVGTVKMGGNIAGMATTVPVSLRLTCDANGNLS